MDLFLSANELTKSSAPNYPPKTNQINALSSFSRFINDKPAPRISAHKNTGEMDAAQYKQFIYEKIANMPVNPYRAEEDLFISISEECFAAMQQDPAYEQWVLSQIQGTLSKAMPYGTEVFECISFGATPNDFRQESVTTPNAQQKRAMRERFLRERAERKEELQKLQEKKRLEEKWKKEAYQREYIKLQHLDHSFQIQKENEAIRLGHDYQFLDHTNAMQSAARRRAAAYTSTFVYTDTQNTP